MFGREGGRALVRVERLQDLGRLPGIQDLGCESLSLGRESCCNFWGLVFGVWEFSLGLGYVSAWHCLGFGT